MRAVKDGQHVMITEMPPLRIRTSHVSDKPTRLPVVNVDQHRKMTRKRHSIFNGH